MISLHQKRRNYLFRCVIVMAAIAAVAGIVAFLSDKGKPNDKDDNNKK
jgi:hypothetical protein